MRRWGACCNPLYDWLKFPNFCCWCFGYGIVTVLYSLEPFYENHHSMGQGYPYLVLLVTGYVTWAHNQPLDSMKTARKRKKTRKTGQVPIKRQEY